MDRFYDLDAWKKAREIKKSISEICKKFPKEEKNKLTDQIIRSSRSVTANISEGYGRYNYQESIFFYRIARGSLEETLNHLIDAFDEMYIQKEELSIQKIKIDDCLRTLNGFISYQRKIQVLKKGKLGEKT